MPRPLGELELTGRARTHVVDLDEPPCTLHPEAAAALRAMRAAAAADGLDLVPVSSYRDFARQLAIWNAKFRGERPLYDRAGRSLDPARLAPHELVEAILWWSALPGASRHHWGSDLDLIDRAALPPGYRPQLLPQEFAADGIFRRLDAWLEENMARFGFFRPYATERGGVRPEPWHVSFAPVAEPALAALSVPVLAAALESSATLGLEAVLARLPELHARYVAQIDRPSGRAVLART